MANLGKNFSNLYLKDKLEHATLFLRAIDKDDLSYYFSLSIKNKKLVSEIQKVSTFWADANTQISSHDGELFF